LETNNTPVSATNVRKLMGEKSEEGIRALVPDSTFRYLKDNHLL
jgi:citrate lyase synthetase